MPSLGPFRARANHRSPACSTDPHPPQILPANQIPTPAAPRLGYSTSIPRPVRSESRSPAALLQNGTVSTRGHLSSLSLPLLHSGVQQVAGHDGALRDQGQDLLRRRGPLAS
uniref:Uncharacterized protein n=1 Tax=Zea mays TaxID=4577 RepID=A0A804NFP4_MAIZE